MSVTQKVFLLYVYLSSLYAHCSICPCYFGSELHFILVVEFSKKIVKMHFYVQIVIILESKEILQ